MANLTPMPNQDLLRQVEPESRPLPKGFFTLIGIETLAVIMAGASGAAASGYMKGSLGLAAAFWIWTAFFTVSVFGTLFSPVRWRRFLVMFLEAAAFIVLFGSFREDIRLLGSALFASFVFAVWGDQAARQELSDRLRIKILPVMRIKIGRTMTGYILAVILLSFPIWSASNNFLPEKQFRSFYDGAIKIASVIYPGVKLDATIGEFARTLAAKSISADGSFSNMPQEAINQAILNTADTVLKQAGRNFGMSLTPDMHLSDIFYKYMTNALTGWRQSLGDSFLALWIIAMFIFLRSLGTILVWIAMLVALGVYELLSAIGIFALTGEPSMQERLIINKG